MQMTVKPRGSFNIHAVMNHESLQDDENNLVSWSRLSHMHKLQYKEMHVNADYKKSLLCCYSSAIAGYHP